MKRRKGFTLIELLAVLVVLAILALIAIPIVISIINNTKGNSIKRSIEAYGRAVENAVGAYLLDNDIDYSTLGLGYDDNNGYITPVNNDKIYVEYSGETVTCSTLLVSSAGLITLKGCTVNGSDQLYKYNNKKVSLDDYNEYKIGNTFTLKGSSYHIIADSDKRKDYVIALKDTPLTVSEITVPEGVTVQDNKGDGSIGGVPFGTNSTYETSYAKSIVEAWAQDKFTNNQLKKVNGSDSRLITSAEYDSIPNKYSWIYNNSNYWTMSKASNNVYLLFVGSYGGLYEAGCANSFTIRPVINAYKKAIESSD